MNKKLLSLLALAALTVGSSCFGQLPSTNNIALWFKADAGVTTSGSSVTSWADQSTNANNAGMSIASMRPSYVPNAQNGLPVIRFDGNDDALRTGSTVDLRTGLSIFIVAKNAVSKNYNGLFNIGPSTSDGGVQYHLNDLNLYWQSGANSGNAQYVANEATYPSVYGNAFKNSAGPAANNFYALDVVAASSTATLRVNGAPGSLYLGGEIGTFNYLPPNANYATIGIGYAGFSGIYTNILDGDIGEIIAYNVTLSASDAATVREYLYAKWSIPEPSSVAFVLVAFLFACHSRRR